MFLRKSKKFSAPSILEGIKGLAMFEEEIYLYSLQKMHIEALSSLVEKGKQAIDFIEAEQYCIDQKEPLFSTLFEKILGLFTESKSNYIVNSDKYKKNPTSALKGELDAIRRYMNGYEAYCKNFLKKYATNENMDAEAVLKVLPDDWAIKDTKPDSRDGKEDDILLQYLQLMLNDRIAKDINYKIAKNVGDMEKLYLENDQITHQKAYVLIKEDNICKVCRKKLAGGKAFYVFPNGIVTHSQCAKSPGICPVTNVNFSKKVYDK